MATGGQLQRDRHDTGQSQRALRTRLRLTYCGELVTLILSALSTDAVLLVADRRVTRLATGEVVDDARNKIVLYHGAFAFFFSGLAEIDSVPTGTSGLLEPSLTGRLVRTRSSG